MSGSPGFLREAKTSPASDPFVWRKYGHKLLAHDNVRRLYYACAEKERQGCPAKKAVNRRVGTPGWDRSRDFVLYESEHNHPPPGSHAHATPGMGCQAPPVRKLAGQEKQGGASRALNPLAAAPVQALGDCAGSAEEDHDAKQVQGALAVSVRQKQRGIAERVEEQESGSEEQNQSAKQGQAAPVASMREQHMGISMKEQVISVKEQVISVKEQSGIGEEHGKLLALLQLLQARELEMSLLAGCRGTHGIPPRPGVEESKTLLCSPPAPSLVTNPGTSYPGSAEASSPASQGDGQPSFWSCQTSGSCDPPTTKRIRRHALPSRSSSPGQDSTLQSWHYSPGKSMSPSPVPVTRCSSSSSFSTRDRRECNGRAPPFSDCARAGEAKPTSLVTATSLGSCSASRGSCAGSGPGEGVAGSGTPGEIWENIPATPCEQTACSEIVPLWDESNSLLLESFLVTMPASGPQLPQPTGMDGDKGTGQCVASAAEWQQDWMDDWFKSLEG